MFPDHDEHPAEYMQDSHGRLKSFQQRHFKNVNMTQRLCCPATLEIVVETKKQFI